MSARRVCLLLGLLLGTCRPAQDDDSYLSEAVPETLPAAATAGSSTCCDPCPSGCACFSPGWFVGLGGSYNSVRVDQSFTGFGTTNIFEDSELVAVGAAGGPAPPFHSTLTTFPVAQLGFVKPIENSEWSWGSKFAYKYLGLTVSQRMSTRRRLAPTPSSTTRRTRRHSRATPRS